MLPLIISLSSNMVHFVRTFSIYSLRASGVKIFVIEEVRNYEKPVFIKNIVISAGGGMHTPHPPWVPPISDTAKDS